MKWRNIFIRRTLFYVVAISFMGMGIGQQFPKALILTGNGNELEIMEGYPPWIHEFHNEMISEILKGVVVTEVTSDLSVLNDNTLKEYDLLISYSIFLVPNAEQLNALYRFISEGKSLFTVHCGLLSFLNWDRYEEVMGGIFIGGPASDPESFNISTTNMEFWGYDYSFRESKEHPVSKVVNDFVIKDELYYFQPSTPDFFVIARAENHPVMWWHPVGKGKVMSFTLGHSVEAKESMGYQQLLQNGVRWLLGFPLIESLHLKPFSTRNKKLSDYLSLSDITYFYNKEELTYEVKGNDNIILSTDRDGNIDVILNGKTGTSSVWVKATTKGGLSTQKEFDITIIEDGTGNIASYYGNNATSSSTEAKNVLFDSKNVIDGNPTTRWASDFVDPSWIEIDLQKPYEIGVIKILWEDSYATEYFVEISETGEKWKNIADVKDSDGKTDLIKFSPERARFVRINGTKRARANYGYSLFEVEVYPK